MEKVNVLPKQSFPWSTPYPNLYYHGMPMLDPRAKSGAKLVVVLEVNHATKFILLCPSEFVRSQNPKTKDWGFYDETYFLHQEIGRELRMWEEPCSHDPNDTGFGVAYCRKCDAKLKRDNWEWKVVG